MSGDGISRARNGRRSSDGRRRREKKKTEAFAGEEGSLEPPCDGEDGRVLLRREGGGRDACRPKSREKNRTRRFRLSGFLAVHPSSDSSFCRAGCCGRRFLRFSRVLPCTRLSTIKSYIIRFRGIGFHETPVKQGRSVSCRCYNIRREDFGWCGESRRDSLSTV